MGKGVANREQHCPFLNRPDDARCSQHFHLDDLQHAFGYCFDRYQECPVYAERRAERSAVRHGKTDDRGDDAYVRRHAQHRNLLVQITLPATHRSPQHLAA
jgi:hypothetical protein